MTRQLVLKQVIILFYLLLSISAAVAEENFAQRLLDAKANGKKTPHWSEFKNDNASENTSGRTTSVASNVSSDSSISNSASSSYKSKSDLAEAAYAVQKAYVHLRESNDPIAGYKAGLTSTAGQQKFNVKQALSAILFSSGHVTQEQPVLMNSAGKLMLETEIGFILKQPIEKPVTTQAELATLIESIVPVIELPDIGFENPKAITGLDLIAANVASHQYILGEAKPIHSIANINALITNLYLDDKKLFSGKATDALNDQWQALSWLINQLIRQGHRLEAGELLITGALGKMIPAQPGKYVADFGELGTIQFNVE